MKYGLFNEHGRLDSYVYAPDGDLEHVHVPDGWTLRDMEGAVLEFEDPAQVVLKRLQSLLIDFNEALDDLEELIDE